MKIKWICLIGIVLCLCSSIMAKDFYVSRQGSNDNPGDKDKPFATVQKAVEAARALGKKQERRIIIEEGKYFFDAPLLLDEQDSGLEIAAADGAKVEFLGGKVLAGWEKDGNDFYCIKLPEVKDKKWDFRALVVNGKLAERAKLPEEGRWKHQSVFKVSWLSATDGGWERQPTEEELTHLKYDPNNIGPWLDVNNAELTVYHMWDESLVGLVKNDTNNNILTFSNPSEHPAGAFSVQEYVVWNIREGMKKPGQWYLDRTAGKVVYWPLPNEDIAAAQVIAPVTDSIIEIKGKRLKPAKDIVIRGITLTVTNAALRTAGFGSARLNGAIYTDYAEGCRLFDLKIFNVAGHGIKAFGMDSIIEGCSVHHTGACGIVFAGDGCVVTDNHVHHVGRIYPSAIAIWGFGVNVWHESLPTIYKETHEAEAIKGNEISHNEVHNATYVGISCHCHTFRVLDNLIYKAMEKLCDGGGIYCYGNRNSVVSGNFIRDIPEVGGYGSSAYYLDEKSHGCVVEKNLALNVARPSHNHMSQNNTIRNNVFINDGNSRITFNRAGNCTFQENIWCAKGEMEITNPQAIITRSNNIIFSESGKVKGNGPEDILIDPKIIEYKTGKIRFAADSPARKLGIQPIDVSGAGRRYK